MFFLSNSIQSKIDIRDVLSYEKWQKTVRREEQKSTELERKTKKKSDIACECAFRNITFCISHMLFMIIALGASLSCAFHDTTSFR